MGKKRPSAGEANRNVTTALFSCIILVVVATMRFFVLCSAKLARWTGQCGGGDEVVIATARTVTYSCHSATQKASKRCPHKPPELAFVEDRYTRKW